MHTGQKSTELFEFRLGPGKSPMIHVRDYPDLAAIFKGIYLVITECSLQGLKIAPVRMDLKMFPSQPYMECLIHP